MGDSASAESPEFYALICWAPEGSRRRSGVTLDHTTRTLLGAGQCLNLNTQPMIVFDPWELDDDDPMFDEDLATQLWAAALAAEEDDSGD